MNDSKYLSTIFSRICLSATLKELMMDGAGMPGMDGDT